MEINADLINMILKDPKRNVADSDATWIAEKLKDLEHIESLVKDISTRQDSLKTHYEEGVSHLQKRLEGIQKNCPHYTKKFYPDPSGGGDSFYRCQICGMEES